MQHIIFDIDGTLIESYDFDSECFFDAVKKVTGLEIDTNWSRYKHVTDSGILSEFFEENKIKNIREISEKIKQDFLNKIEVRILQNPIKEIFGASAFLEELQTLDNVEISFATGGWYESAVLKLESAGIDFSKIRISSSNDHYSRVEIMKIAANFMTRDEDISITYFGDASWDLKACKELGINFVLVGDKFEHNQSVKDFRTHSEALVFIDL